MTGELQEYWETKQRIERKLLIGVGVVLMAIWGTACTQGPTGPYTELEPQQGTIAETQETRENREVSRCGDVQVSEAVCEKSLPEPEL